MKFWRIIGHHQLSWERGKCHPSDAGSECRVWHQTLLSRLGHMSGVSGTAVIGPSAAHGWSHKSKLTKSTSSLTPLVPGPILFTLCHQNWKTWIKLPYVRFWHSFLHSYVIINIDWGHQKQQRLRKENRVNLSCSVSKVWKFSKRSVFQPFCLSRVCLP